MNRFTVHLKIEAPGGEPITNGWIRCGHSHEGQDRRAGIGCIRALKAWAAEKFPGSKVLAKTLPESKHRSRMTAQQRGAWSTFPGGDPRHMGSIFDSFSSSDWPLKPHPYGVSKAAAQPEPAPEPKPEPVRKPATPAIPTSSDGLDALRDLLLDENHISTVASEAAVNVIDGLIKSGRLGAQEVKVKVGNADATKVEGALHQAFEDALQRVAQGINVMLVGPRGCGKTFLAKQLGEALDRKVVTVSCSEGMSEAQLYGNLYPTGEAGKFEWHDGPVTRAMLEGSILLLDEMDRLDPNVAASLNEVLASRTNYVSRRLDGPGITAADGFAVVAATNTFGNGANRVYVSANAQDGATLDRFLPGTIEVGYDRNLERRLVGDENFLAKCWDLRDRVEAAKLRRDVSTRAIVELWQKLVAPGLWTQERALQQLVVGWSETELTQAKVK